MKTSAHQNPARAGIRHWRERAGAALVVVLASVVLLLIVALAFLASVAMERQASDAYASGAEVRMLAESAVNLVMGQIREASERDGEVWTSQPGALRTFSTSGQALRVHKLYSAATMSVPAAGFAPAQDLPTDWQSRPSEFVDLNRPVVSRRGTTSLTNYPILDPRAEGMVEGFAPDAANGVSMPVAWLYLLKDGTITSAAGLSATNAPVARMAFWADDETSKLNINTAADGAYWEVPKTGSLEDMRFATNQPAQREFQSYPAHPATTSLAPALWSYFKARNAGLIRTNSSSTTNTFPEVLYGMLPRTSTGGSRGGTVKLGQTNGSLPLKNERLFSSVDELAYLSAATNATNRQPNVYFDRDTLEQTRFFLTAQGRSPELNLFNQPRVTIWPIHTQTTDLHRTPFDKLIAFASTINSNAFYFTRANSRSPTADFSGRNVELYQYLQRLTETPVPGFGGTFSAKYGPDRNQILTEIFDYIRSVNLIDSSTGNTNFVTFTPSTYRPGVTYEGKNALSPTPGLGQVVPIEPGGLAAGTKGFGRYKTINRAILAITAITNVVMTNTLPATTNTVTEAALFFEMFSPGQGHTVYAPDINVVVTTTSPFTVLSGTNFSTTNTFAFSGSNRLNIFPSAGGLANNVGGYEGFAAGAMYVDVNDGVGAAGQRDKLPSGSGLRKYPFVTSRWTNAWNSTNEPTIALQAGSLQARVSTGGSVIQTLDFNFVPKPVVLPMPTVPAFASQIGFENRFVNGNLSWGDPTAPSDTSPDRRSAGRRATSDWWFTTNDVVRSLEATGYGGDLRLIAARSSVVGAFNLLSEAESTNAVGVSPQRVFASQASSSEGGINPVLRGVNGNLGFGKIVKDALSEASFDVAGTNGKGMVTPSLLPPTINGVTNVRGAPGDFDTGIGIYPNGPFINKPDDGNSPTINPDTSQYVPYMAYDQYSLPPGTTFSSPSRQMPSAVMFGSLPTGVLAGDPWQTLLFNPVPASLFGTGSAPHPGANSPPDHLLLDLFQMPVVEPYAISEPFSTAGKVNLNHQIMPFTGIKRTTALRGVIDPVRITAIHDAVAGNQHYKKWAPPGTATPSRIFNSFRYPVNTEETLRLISKRFATNGVYLSASEICEIPLIPDPTAPASPPFPWTTAVTEANLPAFWEFHRNTGDNLRENAYAQVYPRLTTRSNTYTVHVWVQTLQKIPSTQKDLWVEARDRVTGEFRGSFVIERYLNPADTGIPDYATAPGGTNLNSFYRFRVINSYQFAP